MSKNFLLTIALVAMCSCAANPPSANAFVRLDATSDSSAKESLRRMNRQSSASKKEDLAIAILKLNMAGVEGAHELLADPELQKPSIIRIKDRVAGMTADEIIDLANRTSEVKVEVLRK